MKKFLLISGTAIAASLSLLPMSHAQQAASDSSPYRATTVITNAGAHALIEACTTWAIEHNHGTASGPGPALVVIDSAGAIIEARGTVGVPNNLDTALLKAKSALRWRRPSSETNATLKEGHFAPPQFVPGDFPIGGALPIVINGDTIGAMGSAMGGDGEPCIQAAIDKVFKGQAKSTAREPAAAKPATPAK